MSGGGSIPVWFSEEDRRRVEEAAALAGYRHLSKYIRDRTLGRGEGVRDPVQVWAEREDLVGRLSAIHQGNHAATHALLTALLVLVAGKATARERNELLAACQAAATPNEIMTATLPDLAGQLIRFAGEA